MSRAGSGAAGLAAGLAGLAVLGALGCRERPAPARPTRLERLRRVRASRPVRRPGPPKTPAVQVDPPEPGASILRGPCPLAWEDPSSCPSKGAASGSGSGPSSGAASELSTKPVTVAHILIGWRESLPGGARAAATPARDRATARALARRLTHAARARGADFMALVRERSDDPGQGVFTVRRGDRRFVHPFTIMARRLGPGQIDATVSALGYHVIKRMPDGFVPPARPLPALVPGPCPLPGEDPVRCPRPPASKPARAVVEHILIGYKGSRARPTRSRSRQEALRLTIEVVHRVRRKGADWQALRESLSDDPGGGRYEVGSGRKLEAAFERCAFGLSPGNVDAVWTPFGYHVVRRVR